MSILDWFRNKGVERKQWPSLVTHLATMYTQVRSWWWSEMLSDLEDVGEVAPKAVSLLEDKKRGQAGIADRAARKYQALYTVFALVELKYIPKAEAGAFVEALWATISHDMALTNLDTSATPDGLAPAFFTTAVHEELGAELADGNETLIGLSTEYLKAGTRLALATAFKDQRTIASVRGIGGSLESLHLE